MKKKYYFFCLFFFYVFKAIAFENLFQLKAPDIDGNQLPLSEFKGQVVLVVNTASKCGFTYQYESLERIYRKYRDRGFVVLGFPSDDFWQELDSNEEIKEFCEGYQISFPLFAVGPVRGSDKQEVFRFLTGKITHDYPVKFAGTLKNSLSIVKANLLNVIGPVKIQMRIH